MQRFHGTAARQLVLPEESGTWALPAVARSAKAEPPRIRLLQKDMYAELARRRHRAQIAARRWVDESRTSGRES